VRLPWAVEAPLTVAVLRLFREERKSFVQHCINQAPVGIVLARIEDHVSAMAFLQFQTRIADNLPVLTALKLFCPGPDCPGGVADVFIGPPPEVAEYKRVHPEYWKGDLVAFTRGYVQAQIGRGRADVGPPIRIIRLTPAGIEWVQ
jgi:hypothetical protein